MSATAARAYGAEAHLLSRVDRPPTRAEHLRTFGPLPRVADLVRLAEATDLRGRGGAAFPLARKVAAVVSSGGTPVVVANGAEGEPVSKKDRALLRVAPHLVLDGAVLAAQATGAAEVVLGVTRPAPELAAAIRERSSRDDRVTFSLVRVPEGFVSGEETALVRALGGGPAKPTTKPPYPFERGLGKRPTLVQNVETLAHLALLARFGPDGVGRGTTLITLSGAVGRPGVHEVPFGVTLGELLDGSGGVTAEVQGVLVGGFFGRWVAEADARRLVVSPDAIGAGAIVVLPASTCAVAECARVAHYLAKASAKQCGPCTHGLPALAKAIDPAGRGDGRHEARRLAGLVEGRGACRHPDGAARFVTSALELFQDDFARHAAHRRCGRRDEGVLPTPDGRG